MNFSKDVNNYALPLIWANLAQFIIGQLSLHYAANDSNAALSVIAIIQNFLFAFGGILGAFSLSFNIKGAKALADQDASRFQNLLKSSLLLDLIIGAAFLVLCLLFSKTFLQLFYAFDGEILDLSVSYLQIMSPYVLLTLLTFLLTNILKVENKTKPIFGVGLAGSILDALLNYCLVPVFGIKGAAASAMISQTVTVISYFLLVYPAVTDSLKAESTTKTELLKFGLPLALQEILESVLFIMVFDALMGRQQLAILSVYAVISQLLSIVRLPAFMYSGSVSIFLPSALKDGKAINLIAAAAGNAYLITLLFSAAAVLGGNAFARFLSDGISLNIFPFSLFTMIVMGAVPLYEISKMALQSLDDGMWVLKRTAIVNIASILLLLLIQIAGYQTYFTLYLVYGSSLLCLSYLFVKRLLKPQIPIEYMQVRQH